MENNNSIIPNGVKGIEFNVKDRAESLPVSELLRNSKDFYTFEVSAKVPGADAIDATLYPIFYVATVQCFLLEAKLRHDVDGGAAATVDVEKIVNGVAKGAGGSMLVSKFAISTGARTTLSKTATVTLAGYQLAPGDAVALRAAGTLTGARDVAVTVLFGILAKHLPTGANV